MADQNEAVQLTPQAKAAEEDWKSRHNSECPCWKCMWIKTPWIERLDRAQQEIEKLRQELEAKADATQVKPTRRPPPNF